MTEMYSVPYERLLELRDAENALVEAKRNAAKALNVINSFVVVDVSLAPIMEDIDLYVRRIVNG